MVDEEGHKIKVQKRSPVRCPSQWMKVPRLRFFFFFGNGRLVMSPHIL